MSTTQNKASTLLIQDSQAVCYVEGNDLHCYKTGAELRPATADEKIRSEDAGDHGTILVDPSSLLPAPTVTGTWTVTDEDVDAPASNGSYCIAEYDATFELTITKGDESASARVRTRGWVMCGWLRPGAHQDLDGSGLRVWGDSQEGGWTQCDGDGSIDGRPYLRACGTSVEVWPSDDGPGEVQSIDIAEIAPWLSEDEAESIAEDIASRREQCPSPRVEEPSCEAIVEALGCDDKNPVVMGDYEGAGRVLAWVDGDVFGWTWWPTDREIEDACETTYRKIAEDAICELIATKNDED